MHLIYTVSALLQELNCVIVSFVHPVTQTLISKQFSTTEGQAVQFGAHYQICARLTKYSVPIFLS